MIPFFRLIRIENLLFLAIFQILLRYCVVLPILEVNGIEPMLSSTNFVLLVVSTVFLAASGNVINDYFDVKADSINRPERVVVGKSIERRSVLLIHVAFTLIGVLCGLFISFVYRKETYAILFIAIPAILWFYSTHFKKQMLVGNLIVAMLVAVSACLVVSVEFAAIVSLSDPMIINTKACSSAWFYTTGIAFFAFLSNLAREIVKDMEDANGDKACGCHTLPVDMGVRYSKYIVVALEIVLIVALWATYAIIDAVRTVPYISVYYAVAITLPTIAVCVYLLRSKTRRQFSTVSTLCKVVMMLGAMLPLFFYLMNKYYLN